MSTLLPILVAACWIGVVGVLVALMVPGRKG